ncbi:hypothetical protein D3C73_387910 [compost metagenome]
MSGKLIDADKLLEYLNGNPDGYISDVCYEGLKERIERGDFASDPIPLPTIKPGDKVRHKDSPSWGMGVVTHTQHKASVMFDDLYVDLPIKGLEVVE